MSETWQAVIEEVSALPEEQQEALAQKIQIYLQELSGDWKYHPEASAMLGEPAFEMTPQAIESLQLNEQEFQEFCSQEGLA